MASEADDADLGERIRAVIEGGVKILEKRLADLKKAKASAKNTAEIVELMKQAAPLLGQVRRHDQAQVEMGRRLPPSAVQAFLRSLTPETRARFLSEFLDFGGGESETDGNVLSQ